MLERVARDRIIQGIVKYDQAGVESAPELAALLGCSVKDIYRARDRLTYHGERVLEEERKHEERRKKGRAESP